MSVFEFSDAGLNPPPEMLGLWSVAPSPASGQVSFDVASEPPPDAPVWRINLPANVSAATQHLQRGEGQVRASQAALSGVPDRLNTFVQQVQPASSAVSFGVAADEVALPPPEIELLQWLRETQSSSDVSFGLGETLGGHWEQAQQQLRAMVEQMTRLIAHAAWVETRLEGELLARTVAGWGGNAGTLWRVDLDPAQSQLHSRTLALALASRLVWFQTFVTVMQGAVKISLLLGTPGGAVLALPIAWKFVNQVLADVSQHRELAQQLN